jgi:hypothetical protein
LDNVPCPKVFHPACLYLDRAPSGRFCCPWHSCDVCKNGRCFTYCLACVSSWCKPHTPAEYGSDDRLQFLVGDCANSQIRFVVCDHCTLDVRFSASTAYIFIFISYYPHAAL